MVKNAFFITTVAFLGGLIYLLGECRFLIPYRDILLEDYGGIILTYAAALFLNVFTAVYLVGRKFFLSDTGQKLAHIEKQIRSGDSISEELSKLLEN